MQWQLSVESYFSIRWLDNICYVGVWRAALSCYGLFETLWSCNNQFKHHQQSDRNRIGWSNHCVIFFNKICAPARSGKLSLSPSELNVVSIVWQVKLWSHMTVWVPVYSSDVLFTNCNITRSSLQWWSSRSTTAHIVLDLRSFVWDLAKAVRLFIALLYSQPIRACSQMCSLGISIDLHPFDWKYKGGLFDPLVDNPPLGSY